MQNSTEKTKAFVERLAYSINEFCAAVGCSRSCVYADIRAGKLRTFKLGRLTRISRAEVLRRMDEK